MRTALKKWTSVGAAVLVTGLGLAACGSDDGGQGGDGPDTAAVGEDAGTELTEENFFAETTKAQIEAGSSHVVMDLGEAGGTAEGDVILAEDPAETRMSMTMSMAGASGGGEFEMRLVDGVLFMNMGEMSQGKFVKMDLTDESNPMGEQFGSMIDQMDPAKQLENIQDAVTGFEQTGDAEELDGVEALPYVITVDTAAMTEGLEGMQGGAAQMPDEITYTMHVGPDNLPRRITTEVMDQSVVMDYSKWGEDLSVEAPADDEISDQDPFGGMAG